MNIIQRCILVAVAAAAVGAGSMASAQYTLTTLATFNGANGSEPLAGLIADTSGNLFGTTILGGPNGKGVVFEVAAGTHELSTLATFNGTNGAYPGAGLIADASGNLYGTTSQGGANGLGTVFEVSAGTHALATLATFNGANGREPHAGLIADASGNLYGTTAFGGDLTLNNGFGLGTVFEVAALTHALATLATFNGTNGSRPWAGLIADTSGNLYGTTLYGGDLMLNGGYGAGTVFELAAGTHDLSTLASFNGTNGYQLVAGLHADASGNLYGTTRFGGANDRGTVFEVAALTHALATLATFNGENGREPVAGLIADASGNLFGTTSGGVANNAGTVFELAAGTHDLSTLATFNGTNGSYPYAVLLADASGNLYGTTDSGGANGFGTVFELSPVPEPSSLALALLALGSLSLRPRVRETRGRRGPLIFANGHSSQLAPMSVDQCSYTKQLSVNTDCIV